MKENFEDFLRESISNKEKSLLFLKNKIINICENHNLVFNSGMGSYSFVYIINNSSEHYYYSDFEKKDLQKMESNYQFDLENSESQDDIDYFQMKLDGVKVIKSFHNDIIELENMARRIEKIFNFNNNAILYVAV